MSMSTYQMINAQNLQVVRLRNLRNSIEMMNQKSQFNNLYFDEWNKCFDNYTKVLKEKIDDFDSISYGELILASIPVTKTEEEIKNYDTKMKILTVYIEANKQKTESVVPQKRLVMSPAKVAI